jgi:HEAT repeat protein
MSNQPAELQTSWSGKPIGRRPSRRAYLMITGFALALVALPFWFWYDSWFGRRLTDANIGQFLENNDRPRRMQQALVQIGEKMARGDESARRFYPRMIELASHSSSELRQTVAWIMGQDRTYEPFRAALRKLAADSSPLVRRNAALALAAFRDPSGIAEIRLMLEPSTVQAPAGGRLQYRLKEGEYANAGTLLARVDDTEVRSSLPGEVRSRLVPDESPVKAGQPVMELGADDQHVFEALRALFLVGSRDDLDLVRRFLRNPNQKIQEQAQQTLRHIESR